jgi:RNA polymerase sigma-70 factor (ECF subfamily)
LRGDEELERMRGLVAREIQDAIGLLREEQRTAILLDLEGLSEEEMASVLGCAAGTVKSRLSRARAALRMRLADYRR